MSATEAKAYPIICNRAVYRKTFAFIDGFDSVRPPASVAWNSFAELAEERLQVRGELADLAKLLQGYANGDGGWVVLGSDWRSFNGVTYSVAEDAARVFGCFVPIVMSGHRPAGKCCQARDGYICQAGHFVECARWVSRTLDEVIAAMLLGPVIHAYRSRRLRLRVLNQTVRTLFRLLASCKPLKDGFLIQLDWFFYHGEHPPRTPLRTKRRLFLA